MWKQCPQNIRSSRAAMAGSIYMRRMSVEVKRQNQQNLAMSVHRQRNPSFGKIVKNARKPTQNQIGGTNLVHDFSFQKSRELDQYKAKAPLSEKKNICFEPCFSMELPKKHVSHFMEQPENTKIRSIEEKYRQMLTLYEDKKKAIDAELIQLKNGKKKNSIPITSISCVPQSQEKSVMKTARSNMKGSVVLSEKRTSFCDEEKISTISTERYSSAIRKNILASKQILDENTPIQIVKAQKPIFPSKSKVKVLQKYPDFFCAIKQQISLEQQLRNLKLQIPTNQKQRALSLITQKIHIQDNFFDLNQDEIDPFYKPTETAEIPMETLAEKIVESHRKCEKNWAEQVCILGLRESREVFSLLNFQKSREISIKGFVRQIGFILERHCRNRDLWRIYKRLEPLTENNFSAQVTNSQK